MNCRHNMATRRRRKTKSLAVRTFELGTSVPQVIAHRMARMARAGTSPSALDRAEFRRMGLEKVAAANEAWAAMVTQLFLENQKRALTLMQSFWFPWTCPAPTIKSVSSQLNRAAVRVLSKGIPPVHRRVVANAKRLGRTKRR